ncbi:MAG: transporter substrate-binding domain-containing protein [Prevotella sp.]|nr:transporter substrate-binding domain-containing protein [Prevotella sp.]
MKYYQYSLLLLLAILPLSVSAQEANDSIHSFTEEHPLVYEDAWDLWPYAFLNENGEAVGYNIDLLKMLCKELDIPYIVKLKPTQEALNDLKSGHADLMCGMDANFHNEYGQYGKTVIQIFTHSVLHQKIDPVKIKKVEDLANHRVIVHKGSFSHHLMIRNGWGNNAVAYDDMQEAVQKAHLSRDYQIVWNTMSLQYLIRKFQYNDLELVPVNVQHGEYKFMSNNPRLLNQLDSVYTLLNSEGRLQPIQNKWFYPDQVDSGIPIWIWKVVGLLLLLAVGALVYYIVYRLRERKMKKAITRSNERLALILRTSHVNIWLYDINTNTITRFDENGNRLKSPMKSGIFDYQIISEDFDRLAATIQKMIINNEDEAELQVQAKTANSDELRHLTILMSVLHRDKKGHPTTLIGTSSDVTAERLRQIQVKENLVRYQAIFNAGMVDTVAYDANGTVINMNEIAASVIKGGRFTVHDHQVNLRDVLRMDDLDLEHMEKTIMTLMYKTDENQSEATRQFFQNDKFYELQLVPYRNSEGRLQAIFGTGRDVTDNVNTYTQMQHNSMLLQQANDEVSSYIRNTNFVLRTGGVRMVDYSPETHTLSIYHGIGQHKYELTQTRCLTLTHDESKRVTQRILKTMDNLSRSALNATIRTTLRTKNGHPLYLYLSFIPIINSEGEVESYYGMCRDISEIKATEKELAQKTQKAQEVETIKNAFLRNMSYEIRTPLTSVVGFAELFQQEHTPDEETLFIQEIKENSTQLLKLINDILFLSRLDAEMIEFKKQPIDFAAYFGARCETAWQRYKLEGVEYLVDNPYNKLVINVDASNIGIIIDQIAANAAQHTTKGQVRARFDYTGEGLVMAFMDTGSGIAEEKLSHIFERFTGSTTRGTGLGLPICYELVRQMSGNITIKSTIDKGTMVWVTIPCECSEIERK